MPTTIAADALDLAAFVRPGDTVICGQGCAEPRTLTEALARQRAAIGRFRVFLGPSFAGTFRPDHGDHIDFAAYAGSGSNADLARAGLLDIVPSHYSDLPGLFAAGILRADVVLLQLAPGGDKGPYNMGLTNDYQIAAARNARVVIAEVNQQMPWSFGAEWPDDARIDAIVPTSRAPAFLEGAALGETERRIAAQVASIVPDGATIEVGIGALPDAVMAALAGHRDLGIHSGMLGDRFVDLVEIGAVTNALKPVDRGVSIGGILFGTRRLFDFVHRNRAFRLMPPSYTHGIEMLRQMPRFAAINSAVEVDITGQVNGEIAAGVHVGTVGGQVDFMRGAAAAGGRSIVALPATAKGGSVSRIVARSMAGIVTSLRSDMDVVVTEHGVAELRGRSLAERARRLIAIAAPSFRGELERAAHPLLRAAGA